jgi:predicted DCC family thiol-disulfide oxidoreductase YuxK
MKTLLTRQKPIVFFDGYCGLCNWFVEFILKQDKNHDLLFAPLQGSTAQTLIGDINSDTAESLVFYDTGQAYRHSDAIFRVLRYLGGFWVLFSVLTVVPTSWRNAIYSFIAKRRYQWFSSKEACRIPSTEEKNFFLP